MSTLGADVLRLWVAATDYANEISVSDEILKRMSDSYRRIRNTVRFLLGNLRGLRPGARRRAGRPDWSTLDRWALARTRELQEEVVAAYRNYDFHLIYQKVHNFCVVDLGGFYLDVLKDRLYTTPAERPAAPLGADGDVLDRRGDGALAGADPVVHGRGDLAVHAGRARRVGVPRDLGRAAGAAAATATIDWPTVLEARAGRAARARAAARGRRDRRAARCERRRSTPRPDVGRRSSRSATSCASC